MDVLHTYCKIRCPDRSLAFLGLVAIGLYWVGTHVPVPGVNTDALALVNRHGALGLYDLFTGGNLGRGTIFTLGIMPYVTALCIAYLATALGFARGWGARGRRAMAWSVRGVALVLGVVQAIGLAIWLEQQTAIANGVPLVTEPGWSFRLTLVLTFTTITACLIWLSDEISRRGIGWGVSLLFSRGWWSACRVPCRPSWNRCGPDTSVPPSSRHSSWACSYTRRSSCSLIRPGGGAGLGMQAEQGPSSISGRATGTPNGSDSSRR